MISWTSSSSRVARGVVAAALLAVAPASVRAAATGIADPAAVAVLAPDDVTMAGAPVERIAAAIEEALRARGFHPLPVAAVDGLLEKYRERYTGGVSSRIAAAFGGETGVAGILVTSVDDWDASQAPRVALTCRWIGATEGAPVRWIDGSARHALEKPGAFGLGLGKTVDDLLAEAVDEIAASLADQGGVLAPGPGRDDRGDAVARRFRPRTLAMVPGETGGSGSGATRRVAVLPFFTDGRGRGLGDVFALQFVRHLAGIPGYEVIEPGVVRQALLDTRVIQDEGVSLTQVDAVRALLNVDFVISGRITEYDGLGLGPGSPAAGFSARAIDATSRRVVWASFSFAHGDDGLRLFGTRWVRSGVGLASELVRGVIQRIDKVTREGRAEGAPAPTTKGSS